MIKNNFFDFYLNDFDPLLPHMIYYRDIYLLDTYLCLLNLI